MPILRLADDVALVVSDGDGLLRRDNDVVRLPSGGAALACVADALATPCDEQALRDAIPPSCHPTLDVLIAHKAVVPDPGSTLLMDLHSRTVAALGGVPSWPGQDTAFLAREAGTGRLIALPDGADPDAQLADVLRRRRTVQRFTGEPVPLEAVAAIVGRGAGVTGTPTVPAGPRAYPSGGALYPVELHLVAMRVDDLGAGIYRYQPAAQGLVLRAPAPDDAQLGRWFGEHPVGGLACLVLLSMDCTRPSLSGRYGGKAYRLALLEAGHIAQNLLLMATALGFGTLPMCGFDGDPLALAAGLARPGEVVLYVLGLGRSATG